MSLFVFLEFAVSWKTVKFYRTIYIGSNICGIALLWMLRNQLLGNAFVGNTFAGISSCVKNVCRSIGLLAISPICAVLWFVGKRLTALWEMRMWGNRFVAKSFTGRTECHSQVHVLEIWKLDKDYVAPCGAT